MLLNRRGWCFLFVTALAGGGSGSASAAGTGGNGDPSCRCLSHTELRKKVSSAAFTTKFNVDISSRRALQANTLDTATGQLQDQHAAAINATALARRTEGNGGAGATTASPKSSYKLQSSYTVSEDLPAGTTGQDLEQDTGYMDAKRKGLANALTDATVMVLHTQIAIVKVEVSSARALASGTQKEVDAVAPRRALAALSVKTQFEIVCQASGGKSAMDVASRLATKLADSATINLVKTFTAQALASATFTTAAITAAGGVSLSGSLAMAAVKIPGMRGVEVIKVAVDGETYFYESTYGTGGDFSVGSFAAGQCAAYDLKRPPSCGDLSALPPNTFPQQQAPVASANAPAFCEKQWCYIDNANCAEALDAVETSFLADVAQSKLFYSYKTCGRSNSFEGQTLRMKATAERYILSLKASIEQSYKAHKNGQGVCQSVDPACKWDASFQQTDTDWPTTFKGSYGQNIKYTIDPSRVGVYRRSPTTTTFDPDMMCVFDDLKTQALKIAAAEHDGKRLGYMYMGFQRKGSFFEWPKSNGLCDTTADESSFYDPRIRPWYAISVSGPKDVMLVVDRSGSMRTQGRMKLARDAAKAVVRTLSWVD